MQGHSNEYQINSYALYNNPVKFCNNTINSIENVKNRSNFQFSSRGGHNFYPLNRNQKLISKAANHKQYLSQIINKSKKYFFSYRSATENLILTPDDLDLDLRSLTYILKNFPQAIFLSI